VSGIGRVKPKARIDEFSGDVLADAAQRRSRRRRVGDDLQIDVFGHAPQKAMRPAESGSAAKDQPAIARVRFTDRR
jgi:hypothetical protein